MSLGSLSRLRGLVWFSWVALVMTVAVDGQEPMFTRLAGTDGGQGYFDGEGADARFSGPFGLATDAAGNVYVADTGNHTIRMITPGGEVSTLAGEPGLPGFVNGDLRSARLSEPYTVAVDADGIVFVGESSGVRRINPWGTVEEFTAITVSGDGHEEVDFDRVRAIAVDSAGNLYLAEWDRYWIRKVSTDGVVTTLAGDRDGQGSNDGIGVEARFESPRGLAVDGLGNVYVSDARMVRRISPDGNVTTLAGSAEQGGNDDGVGAAARFSVPLGMTIDTGGNLIIADRNGHRIRRVTPEGSVTTVAGSDQGNADGVGTEAKFSRPHDVAADPFGNIYVADSDNDAIRRVSPDGAVITFAGRGKGFDFRDGTGTEARFLQPSDIALDGDGNLIVADRGSRRIRMIAQSGEVTTLAGSDATDGDGPVASAGFRGPAAIAVSENGDIYVADVLDHTIRKISSGIVTTIAGASAQQGSADGIGSEARFNGPSGIAVDDSGNVFVADRWNSTIRKITPDGMVSTFAGVAGEADWSDGTIEARFSSPVGIVFDLARNLIVSDANNHVIRQITPAGEVTTIAGIPGEYGLTDGPSDVARFAFPLGIAIDSDGTLYVSIGEAMIRSISPDGIVTTIGGGFYHQANVEGDADDVRFISPNGMAVNDDGDLFIADVGADVIFVRREGLADAATIDRATSGRGEIRTLSASHQTGSSWQWRVVRRPAGSAAAPSPATGPSVTFTPDEIGQYVFRLEATGESRTSVTFVELDVIPARQRAVRR